MVALDIAGTTLSVADDVPNALRHALSPLGLAVSDAQIEAVRGRSKRGAIRELLTALTPVRSEAELDGLAGASFSAFRERLLTSYRTAAVRPIDGAVQTLAWLQGQGTQVALATGFDRELTELLLTRVGWMDAVGAVVCDDDVAHGRPAPDLIFEAMSRTHTRDAARVVAVGDTTADLLAAKSAGVGSAVGVLSGAHTLEMLHGAPHDFILPSVADLPSVLRATREHE